MELSCRGEGPLPPCLPPCLGWRAVSWCLCVCARTSAVRLCVRVPARVHLSPVHTHMHVASV